MTFGAGDGTLFLRPAPEMHGQYRPGAGTGL
jgi:hypothetical protein